MSLWQKKFILHTHTHTHTRTHSNGTHPERTSCFNDSLAFNAYCEVSAESSSLFLVNNHNKMNSLLVFVASIATCCMTGTGLGDDL